MDKENKKRGIALIDVVVMIYLTLYVGISLLGKEIVAAFDLLSIGTFLIGLILFLIISAVASNTVEKRKIQLALMIGIHVPLIMFFSRAITCFCGVLYPPDYVKDIWHYLESGRSYTVITIYLTYLMYIYIKKLKPFVEKEVIPTNKVAKYFINFVVLGIAIGFTRFVFSSITGIHLSE